MGPGDAEMGVFGQVEMAVDSTTHSQRELNRRAAPPPHSFLPFFLPSSLPSILPSILLYRDHVEVPFPRSTSPESRANDAVFGAPGAARHGGSRRDPDHVSRHGQGGGQGACDPVASRSPRMAPLGAELRVTRDLRNLLRRSRRRRSATATSSMRRAAAWQRTTSSCATVRSWSCGARGRSGGRRGRRTFVWVASSRQSMRPSCRSRAPASTAVWRRSFAPPATRPRCEHGCRTRGQGAGES